jgi:penicillin V acylase-like amidase (Ntn superfamily)
MKHLDVRSKNFLNARLSFCRLNSIGQVFILISIAAVLFSAEQQASACTAFCLLDKTKNEVVVAKSYDWFIGHGHGAIYTNLQGTVRQAAVLGQVGEPMKWSAKFGSLTLTQFGRGFPLSGINEKGLVVEVLQLDESQYNSSEKDKPFLNESEWIQYHLDSFERTKDVVDNISKIRVISAFRGAHYFVADASGESAVIEFLDGKAVAHYGQTLPVAAITNNTYPDSLKFLNQNLGPLGGSTFGKSSEYRFQAAALATKNGLAENSNDIIQQAWKGLDAARVGGLALDTVLEPSQWNLVYNISKNRLFFRTRSMPTIKEIDLSKLKFKKSDQALMLDMNLAKAGDVTGLFEPYSVEKNTAMINMNWILLGKEKRDLAIKAGAL